MKFQKKDKEGVFKSLSVAYLVLILHVVLIAALGLLVLFFRGVVNYILWIFIGGSAILLAAIFMFYRRVKKEGKSIQDILLLPEFKGRSVEVSIMGGFASFKIGNPANTNNAISYDAQDRILQLEDPDMIRIRELKELANLLEKDLITKDEYEIAKKQIFQSYPLQTTGHTHEET